MYIIGKILKGSNPCKRKIRNFKMFNIILFSYFFYGFSPALGERSLAIGINPAGLSYKKGFEMYMDLKEIDLPDPLGYKYYYSFSCSAYSLGFRFLKEEDIAYSIGSGFDVFKGFSIGYSYNNYGKEKFNTIGIMIRPFSFLSAGIKADIYNDRKIYRGGLGIKLFSGRMTLAGDFKMFNKIVESYFFTMAVEPVEGLSFYLHSEIEDDFKEYREIYAGVEISFGKLKFSYVSNLGERINNIRVYRTLLSKEIYPGLLKAKNKYLEVTLKGKYSEEREKEGFIFFKFRPSFYDILSILEKAGKDSEIEGVVLYFRNPELYPAQAEELRDEILRLRKKNKKVIAYGDYFDERDYYIASACDKIVLSHEGHIFFAGPYVETIYFKKTLEKLGIEAQIERIGKYKSAVEPFLREKMSKENREQVSLFLERIFNKEIKEIAQERGMNRDSLINLIKEEGFFNSDEALKAGLVDKIAFETEIKTLIKEWFEKKVKFVSSGKWAKKRYISRDFIDKRAKIALLIAEGSIVVGESGKNPVPVIGGKMLGSSTMQEILEKIRKDKSIKACVIRVSSPGGSALASEIIWNSIRRLSEEKPVVISMGGIAASGGYYLSCAGSYVFADELTLTGSIGILGGKLAFERFFEKLGITFDRVKIMEHSDAFSWIRPFKEKELEELKEELLWGYKNFVKRVAISRNLKEEYVDSIAQGRIWSGYDAKNIKLVDETGGLMKAIEKARELAGIKGKIEVVVFPKKGIRSLVPLNITLNSPLMELQEKNFIYYAPFMIGK